MTLCSVLEALAVDTWERLRDSQSLGIRFGEETITDLLLLDIKRKNPPRTRVVQTPKSSEKDQGTDWEWWIGSPRVRWIRFAVQAKKLNQASQRYHGLKHQIGPVLQIDLLERYATSNQAIPLYCFYNYAPLASSKRAWRCCQTFDEPQLSCTVAPSSIVRRAIDTWGAKNFEWVHQHPDALPWRCLARCPKLNRIFAADGSKIDRRQLSQQFFGPGTRLYTRLPTEVEEGRQTGRLERFSPEFYDREVGLYPRRVVVLEFAPDEDVKFGAG